MSDNTAAYPQTNQQQSGKHALLVAAGIFLSRIFGLVRARVFAYYFGQTWPADAFNAAFRIPNMLQNLFGEGALSASFIPVYAKLLAQDDEEEAGRVAGAIFAILALVVAALVLLGIFAAPWLVGLIAVGFTGEKRELTVQIVRVLFPGTGLLVLSAWCLGILNSHKRFFLSYVSPVLWNLAIIASLFIFGHKNASDMQLGGLAMMAAWGSVAGSAIQFGAQLPAVFRLVKRLRVAFDIKSAQVRTVVRNFLPAFVSRGVIQISAFVDQGIASFLGDGAVTALTNAQILYTLPVSLFGMSVSAVELAAMSGAVGDSAEINAQLRQRLNNGMQRIAFFIVPSAVAFLTLGNVIVGALLQSGRFTAADSNYVWAILAGSSIGLLASTLARLNSSTYYALQDTRTPLKFAIVRVTLGMILGYIFALYAPRWFGLEAKWGAAFLTAASGLAGWTEFLLLRRQLNSRIGRTGLPFIYMVKLWSAAFLGSAIAWAVKLGVGPRHPLPLAVIVLAPYGLTYFILTAAFGVAEARAFTGRFSRLVKR